MPKRKGFLKLIGYQLTGFILLLITGCASKVLVPPEIDLQTYDSIGLIVFSSNTEGNLNVFATQKFLETIQSAQTGIRILELGTKEEALNSVQRSEFNIDAIKAITKKHRVAALFTGHLDVTDVKPKVQLSSLLQSMAVAADVEASLTARLYAALDGATIWTDSARRRESIAHVRVGTNQPVYFDATDPEQAYGELVYGLVRDITRDYRPRYVRK